MLFHSVYVFSPSYIPLFLFCIPVQGILWRIANRSSPAARVVLGERVRNALQICSRQDDMRCGPPVVAVTVIITSRHDTYGTRGQTPNAICSSQQSILVLERRPGPVAHHKCKDEQRASPARHGPIEYGLVWPACRQAVPSHVIGPSRRPRHSLSGHFSCGAGLMSMDF